MISEINKRLLSTRVLPLISASDVQSAVETARALVEGGLSVIEIVLRSPQAHQALQSGAQFIVSPGFDRGVLEVAEGNFQRVTELTRQSVNIAAKARNDHHG